jgi:L-asparagine transporter-like permease
MRIDGPTILLTSVVAATVSAAVMRMTREMAQERRADDLLTLRIGAALVLLGVLLICIALQRMLLL